MYKFDQCSVRITAKSIDENRMRLPMILRDCYYKIVPNSVFLNSKFLLARNCLWASFLKVTFWHAIMDHHLTPLSL